MLEGDTEDVARESKGKVQTKECGETILLPFVVHQVLIILRLIKIILYAQDSNPW
jgi:hypothetical protein